MKSQLENLRRITERKNKEISSLLKNKQELLEEKEAFIDEIVEIKNNFHSQTKHKFVSVLESSHSHIDNGVSHRMKKELMTPDVNTTTKSFKRKLKVPQVYVDPEMRSVGSESYSTLHRNSLKKLSEDKFRKVSIDTNAKQSLYRPVKKTPNKKHSSTVKYVNMQRRSLTPRSFFENSSGIKNKFRRTSSKPLISESENELLHPTDFSYNILSGSQSLLNKNSNFSIPGRNQSKMLEMPNNNIFEEIFEMDDNERLLKQRLNEFELQLHKSQSEKAKLEKDMYTLQKALSHKENALESKIAILGEKIKCLQRTEGSKPAHNYSMTSGGRNRTTKLEPKVLKETYFESMVIPSEPSSGVKVFDLVDSDYQSSSGSKKQKKKCCGKKFIYNIFRLHSMLQL